MPSPELCAGLQDSASGSREMDDTKNGVAGTEEASNTQAETDHNENSVERREDDDSQSLVDSMSPSSEGATSIIVKLPEVARPLSLPAESREKLRA